MTSLSVAVKLEEKKSSIGESDEVTNMSLVENESPIHQIKIPEKKAAIYQYTREELMVIKSRPLSKIRPGCLDPAFNDSRGVWDPERWHLDCKRSETPPDDERGGRGDASSESHKRRSGDPRERLRKEQEGIVLSPQRRSFNSGCCVTQQVGKRPESPLGKNERDLVHRDMPARRIGSGRIPPRDMWDFRESDPSTDFIFRPPANREREERRSFGREFERERERDRTKDRHRNNREDRSNYNDRRRAHSDSHEEEPEWFSGGPTSQHDTIELRGFEDIPEEQGGTRESRKQSGRSKNNRSGSGNKKTADTSSISSSSAISSNTSGSTQSGPGGRSTPTLGTVAVPLATLPSPITVEDGKSFKDSLSTKSPNTTTESSVAWQEKKEDRKDQSDFNLDDFLKGDAIPGLLTNGATAEGPAGSRFSQWFRRESPVNKLTDSRRSSVHEELLSNMLGDIVIPQSESNIYFAPISPAANTATVSSSGGGGGRSSGLGGGSETVSETVADSMRSSNVGKPIHLLDLLQRGGQGDNGLPVIKGHSIRDLEATGKLHSVEELEAKMRQGISSNKTSNKKSDEDLSAFNKLLAQVSDGKAIPATVANGPIPSKPQPLNFLQMLSKSQQEANLQSMARPVTAVRPADVGISSVNPLSGFGALGQQNVVNNAVPPGLAQTQSQQMQIPQDLVLKLLQVQQQQQQQQQQKQQQQRQQQHHHHHHHNHHQQQQQQQQHQQELLSKLFAAGQQSMQGSRLGPMGPQFSIPPPPSLSPLPPELQVMVANAQPSRELLQRPEAKAILQGLRYGEITPQHLVQQLQNPAMQHRHREVLVSILKMQMQQGTSPRTVSPHPHPPQPDLLHQIMLQQQQQQHQQQQLRIPSPLNSVLPRVPSPRELIAHTQNIMQSALIKKKLEEQRENYRKRQEMQQSLSPSMPGGGAGTGGGVKVDSSSPAKHLSSPTPLAFTPTSVLRKMTAEKESEATNMNIGIRNEAKNSGGGDQIKSLASQSQQYNHIQQHQMRQQSGGPPPRSQQSGGIQWNMPKQHQQGRAIVKGNTYQYGSNMEYQQQHQTAQHQQSQSQSQLQQQQSQQSQQQQRHNSVIGSSGSNNGSFSNMPRSKMSVTTPQTNLTAVPPQFNSLMMMHRPTNQSSSGRAQTLQAHFASLQQQQQQQQRHQNNLGPSLQQLLMNQNFGASHSSGKNDSRMQRGSQSMPVRQGQNASLGSSSTADLSTSPTTNQLARWFTRAGQLPDMPSIPSTQKILSLEELERHQQSSAAVHN
ncbi:hypothetical protein R5R35_007554 [Gryllus longicercus]|uniref:Eukaryotic translation initiation factor 4E transporter n=1 Tax=Gryllus longicercus TaxID=2509291 RepID=A0AAN9VTS2_9ORTH